MPADDRDRVRDRAAGRSELDILDRGGLFKRGFGRIPLEQDAAGTDRAAVGDVVSADPACAVGRAGLDRKRADGTAVAVHKEADNLLHQQRLAEAVCARTAADIHTGERIEIERFRGRAGERAILGFPHAVGFAGR